MKTKIKWLSVIASKYSGLTKGMTLLGGIAVLLMCLYVTIDVIGRYTMNNPLPASFELPVILMVFIVFWSISYVQARGGHMRLEFLWRRFSPRGQDILDIVTAFIGLFIFAIITWQVWIWTKEALISNEQMEGVWGIPYFPARLGLTIGAFCLCLQYVIDIAKHGIHLFSIGKEDFKVE